MKYSLLALLPLAACNVVPRVDLTPTVGQFELDGAIGITETGNVGEQDFDSLGLGEEESTFQGRADVNWLGFQLSLAGFETGYSGRGTTTAEISSGSGLIGPGVGVDTDLDLSYLNAAFTFDLIPGDIVDLGIGLGGTALDVDMSVTEIVSGATVEANQVLPIPEIAGRAALRLWRLGLYAHVGWIEGEYGDFDGEILDLDVHGRVRLFGGDERFAGHLTAGYRLLDVDFDFDDGNNEALADFELSGPYVGITLSF
ncbi:MAG: hypothetical protein AAF682_12340 [Planctomycetota bacterium]